VCSLLAITDDIEDIIHDYIVVDVIVKVGVDCLFEVSIPVPFRRIRFVVHNKVGQWYLS